MYADTITPSMSRAIDETERRRAKQDAFNKAHGIVPKTVKKSVRDLIEISKSSGSGSRGKNEATAYQAAAAWSSSPSWKRR